MAVEHHGRNGVIDLDTFIALAVPYERWRAPIDARLRRAALIGAGCTVACCLAVIWAEPLGGYVEATPLLLLRGLLLAIIRLGASSKPALLAALGSALLLQGLGVALSDWLRSGPIRRHYLVLAGVASGAAAAIPLCLIASILIINILVIAAAIILIIVIGRALLVSRRAVSE